MARARGWRTAAARRDRSRACRRRRVPARPARGMSAGLTLAIDASTYRGTVAVVREQRVVATSEVAMRGEREERLMPAIAAALGSAGIGVADVERVVVGGGPGS